jgi:hypothetical protein
MRKNVLLNLGLMILAVRVSAGDGVTQDIEKTCKLNFPATPHITDVDGMKNYVYATDSCSYLVQAKPVSRQGIVHDTATLSAFYGGAVRGILRGARGTMIGSKQIGIGGLRAEELEYIKGDKDHQPVSICSRILFVNSTLLVYSFSAPYSRFAALKNLKDHFFNSVNFDGVKAVTQVTSARDTNEMDNTSVESSPASIPDTGTVRAHPVAVHTELVKPNTLHFIISFALCILLLAGTLYILVRWKKRKGVN